MSVLLKNMTVSTCHWYKSTVPSSIRWSATDIVVAALYCKWSNQKRYFAVQFTLNVILLTLFQPLTVQLLCSRVFDATESYFICSLMMTNYVNASTQKVRVWYRMWRRRYNMDTQTSVSSYTTEGNSSYAWPRSFTFGLIMLTGGREHLNLNQKIILGVKNTEYDNGWKRTVPITRNKKKYLTVQLLSGRWTTTMWGLQRGNTCFRSAYVKRLVWCVLM